MICAFFCLSFFLPLNTFLLSSSSGQHVIHDFLIDPNANQAKECPKNIFETLFGFWSLIYCVDRTARIRSIDSHVIFLFRLISSFFVLFGYLWALVVFASFHPEDFSSEYILGRCRSMKYYRRIILNGLLFLIFFLFFCPFFLIGFLLNGIMWSFNQNLCYNVHANDAQYQYYTKTTKLTAFCKFRFIILVIIMMMREFCSEFLDAYTYYMYVLCMYE